MKILVVDDEAGLAREVAAGLASEGMISFAAESAEEAVQISEREGGIDVLVADVIMDGTDGFTLRDTFLSALPGLRTIFITEYDLSDYADRIGDTPVVGKPVDVAALAAMIRAANVPTQPTPRAVRATPRAAGELAGRKLGAYHLEGLIDQSDYGPIYRAEQTTMARKVRFCTLSAAKATDPDQVKRFIADASVKANVRHAAVLAVYEAGEQDGTYFYACEDTDSTSLAALAAKGVTLDRATSLRVLQTVAEVVSHLGREKMPHEPIRASHILLDARQQVRIVNIAAYEAAEEIPAVEEIRAVTEIVAPVLAPGPDTEPVRQLLARASAGDSALRSWAGLAQEAKNLVPKVALADAYKLDARERAAIKAVEEGRKRQKRNVLLSTLGSLVLLAVALGVVAWLLVKPVAVRAFDTMVEIPGGEFVYQDGEKLALPAFWIDQHEVTIGQYAQFLEWVEANPTEAEKLAHPEMPRGKSHVPVDWADKDLPGESMPGYYTRARRWGKFKEAALDVNSPVFGLDWFDAYAYAKWRGRRLPTEQEWEKAARGSEGNVYPWGNEPAPARVNSGADASRDPAQGGQIDGFKRWSPVDALAEDRSPFGVMGMGGNVSEWTATWAESPDLGGVKVPVIRGGNWGNPDVDTRRRLLRLDALQSDVSLGFRTVADQPPPPVQP